MEFVCHGSMEDASGRDGAQSESCLRFSPGLSLLICVQCDKALIMRTMQELPREREREGKERKRYSAIKYATVESKWN